MKNTLTLFTALCLFVTSATAQVVDVVTGLTFPSAVALDGDDLYIAELGSQISKADLSLPLPITANNLLTTDVAAIRLHGNDLYYTSESGTWIRKIDITQTNPTPVTVVENAGLTYGMYINGNDLYVADINGRILQLDISQPFPTTATEVISGLAGTSISVIKQGDFLYYAGFSSGQIYKIDLTQPTPTATSVVSGLIEPLGLTVNGSFLYVTQGIGSNKVSRIDLNASNPTIQDVVTGLAAPRWCAFDGIDLYIAEQEGNKISKLEINQPSMSALGTVCEGSNNTGLGGASPVGGIYSGTGVTDDGNGHTFTFDASVAGVGTTTVTYTAAGGSGLTATADITVSVAIVASAVVDSNAYCFGFQDGGASASATGGTAPYSYLWDNAATTASIQGVGAGTYTVMITDANGCTSNASVTITEPTELTVATSSTDDSGSGDGTATATPTGGASGNYTYSWNTTPLQTTATATGLAAGTYQVTVTNLQAPCTATATVTVNSSAVSDNDCSGANDINSLFGGAVNTPMTSSLYDHSGYTSTGDPSTGFDCHYNTDPLQNTIWFSFDGDGNTYRIRTVDCSATNPHSDAQAALYSGDCNNLTPVVCNDDEDANNNLLNVQFDVETTQGTTYYMLVDGYDGEEGEFCLEVTKQGSSSIFEADYNSVDIYPNPSNNVINWNGVSAQTAEVFDNAGRSVLSVIQPNGTIDISELTEGIYILKLFTEEGAFTSRVVKQQ